MNTCLLSTVPGITLPFANRRQDAALQRTVNEHQAALRAKMERLQQREQLPKVHEPAPVEPTPVATSTVAEEKAEAPVRVVPPPGAKFVAIDKFAWDQVVYRLELSASNLGFHLKRISGGICVVPTGWIQLADCHGVCGLARCGFRERLSQLSFRAKLLRPYGRKTLSLSATFINLQHESSLILPALALVQT